MSRKWNVAQLKCHADGISHQKKVAQMMWTQDMSAIDFGPDRSIPSAGHAPKVGHNQLDCSIDLNLYRGTFRYIGHCVVSIFEAIGQPVHKIIQ